MVRDLSTHVAAAPTPWGVSEVPGWAFQPDRDSPAGAGPVDDVQARLRYLEEMSA
jgi:hypothetical protein